MLGVIFIGTSIIIIRDRSLGAEQWVDWLIAIPLFIFGVICLFAG